jgi:hypothetical protein
MENNVLTFLQFMEHKSKSQKKYISIQYDEDTQLKLRKWCEKNGFDLTVGYDGEKQNASDFDFHTTIFFSTSMHDITNGSIKIKNSTAKITGIELLGENHDIPVFKIESETINNIRSHYKTVYNMKDAWPSYKPHISLSYNKEQIPDISKIKLPKFTLYFSELKIDEAKDF